MKINSEKLKIILDKINNDFIIENGYYFCRCFDCAFSVLLNNVSKSSSNEQKICEVIQQINSDYLFSADYYDYLGKSGLRCGNSCLCYEEHREAVPFLFWENDKTHINIILNLLSDKEFLDCF